MLVGRQQHNSYGASWYDPDIFLMQEMTRLGPTMYFGELALLRGSVRAATIKAASNVDLLALDRSEFAALMGPLAAHLEEQAAKYGTLASAKRVLPRPAYWHDC